VGESAGRRFLEFFTAAIRAKRFGCGFAAAVTNRGKTALTPAKPNHEKALSYLRFFVLNG
jgi:hypothetical protein